MSMKLYVGNLSFKTTTDDLRAAVEQYAPVTSIDVVMDRMTGQSRGFAFVEVGENGENSEILQTIVSLAKNLKMKIIIEIFSQ